MAINIEVKQRLREIEARLKALEDRPQGIISQETLVELAKLEALNRPETPKKKMCPKCGVKPAYFFHVKHCTAEKNKNNGDDGNRSTSDT